VSRARESSSGRVLFLSLTRSVHVADLPPTLISRFDLLYLVLDKIDESGDRRLAKHLVGLYLEDKPETGGQDILVRPSFSLKLFSSPSPTLTLTVSFFRSRRLQAVEMLTAYITYSRSKIHPVLTEEASTALVNSYVEMRKVGEDPRSSERRITATTRQLESMIRLSEAHARMRFSETVDLQDVKEAGRLIREAIRESAVSPDVSSPSLALSLFLSDEEELSLTRLPSFIDSDRSYHGPDRHGPRQHRSRSTTTTNGRRSQTSDLSTPRVVGKQGIQVVRCDQEARGTVIHLDRSR